MDIDQMDTFSRVRASIIKQKAFYDRSGSKHVRFSKGKGLYLHRGLGFGSKSKRLAKRRAAGKEIYKSIVFEHSAATAKAVYTKVFGKDSFDRPITIKQLKQLDKELQRIKTRDAESTSLDKRLSEPEQVAFLARQAKMAARDNGKLLYSVVVANIRSASPKVKAAVIKELANYERALGMKIAADMKAGLEDKGLAVCSERDSIVRTRTVNLVKMLDPDYRAAPLSNKYESRVDADSPMGSIREEFNRQNVHASVDGKSMSQGMRASSSKFIPLRQDCFQEEIKMVKDLSLDKGRPEMLVQTFFLPWQDVKGRKYPTSAASKDGLEYRHDPGRRLFGELAAAAAYRKMHGLPPMKVKILINDPKHFIDDRSPANMSMEKLKQLMANIDSRYLELEVWSAQAPQRDSHHKKMSVAVGGKGPSAVLVMTANHDSSTMLDSGIRLKGRDPAIQQRKQVHEEILRSGKLIAHNVDGVSLSRKEGLSRLEMEQRLERKPPKNNANAGNTVMAHQRANPKLKNQFRLSEPYTLMKSAIRSAKSSVRIVMPYFQLLDLNEEIKGALARGVDVQVVLATDMGSQELFGQSNRDSAEDLSVFRAELAEYNGENNVGKLGIGWLQGVGHGNYNPLGSNSPHQKYMNVDGAVTVMGSFNADYQSMHSAEQMVMVPNSNRSNRFMDYMASATRTYRRDSSVRKIDFAHRAVRSYVGVPSYPRLALNTAASKPLPRKPVAPDFKFGNQDADPRMHFESIDE